MKILLITEIYPSPKHGTKDETIICHYFAKEWTKLGHEVKVVRFNPLLPLYYTLVAKLLKPFFKKKNWSVNFLNSYRKQESYIYEGIPVIYIPLFRKGRGKPLSEAEYERAFVIAQKKLEGYEPNIIVGHWGSMSPLLIRYKQLFPNAKTGVVLHEKLQGALYGKYLGKIDVWGFRNKAIKESFEKYHGRNYSGFICSSGIPKEYIQTVPKTFSAGIRRFAFVGKLLELKRVENTIQALNNVFGEEEYHFDVVGDGVCMNSLKDTVAKLNMESKVTFHGWLSRDKAQQIVETSDCFIMVSDHEAFGLVYVEAMAKGCITIGTKGQGADGIIEDGKNGFLCPPKDLASLILVIKRIKDMSKAELSNMSEKAIQTAATLTDEVVAQQYLDSIAKS